MSEKDNGGPAFPNSVETNEYMPTNGMALRDWFAGKALNSHIEHYLSSGARPDWKDISESCYEAADAMLQARKP